MNQDEATMVEARNSKMESISSACVIEKEDLVQQTKYNKKQTGDKKMKTILLIAIVAAMSAAQFHRIYLVAISGGMLMNSSNGQSGSLVSKRRAIIDVAKRGERDGCSNSSSSTSMRTSASVSFSDIYPDIHDPKEDSRSGKWPRIAWLMSFPNSGTSFTMRLIGRVSNRTTATNYGRECVVSDPSLYDHPAPSTNTTSTVLNIPVHPTHQQNKGPWLLKPQPTRSNVPPRYIATKTHCGGRCTDCGPSSYLETERTFRRMCAWGGMVYRSNNPNQKQTEFRNVVYDDSIVARAIHLIRDPFDNAVSRFHLEYNEHTKRTNSSSPSYIHDEKRRRKHQNWLERYHRNVTGFHDWCHDLDLKFHLEESEHERLLGGSKVLDLFEKIPCHADFYRYGQWHDMARRTIRSMNLPGFVLYYEDYTQGGVKDVTKSLFRFLELDMVDGTIPDFIGGKTYDDYFTRDERNHVMELLDKLVHHDTFRLFQRYRAHL